MKNVILSDCEKWKIEEFKQGLEEATNEKFIIEEKRCIGKRNFFNNLYRYLIYMLWPIKVFLNRKKYNIIIGWQQFFTIFLAFYCRLFRVKKNNTIIICNFTYKPKKGLLGKIYKKVMDFSINNDYIDFIHVPSLNYTKVIAQEFNIDINKFIVARFGVEDMYEKWKNAKNDKEEPYVLAIGRSNRDYDFLLKEWKKIPAKYKLLIISDEYKIKGKRPENIILLNNITGNNQYKYIINCKLMIIPIKNSQICSGDTVLLTAMSFEKTVIVTKPSTLEEMYIENNKNGLAIEKIEGVFSKEILKVLCDNKKIEEIGKEARKSFLKNYSRKSMGKKIGEKIKK